MERIQASANLRLDWFMAIQNPGFDSAFAFYLNRSCVESNTHSVFFLHNGGTHIYMESAVFPGAHLCDQIGTNLSNRNPFNSTSSHWSIGGRRYSFSFSESNNQLQLRLRSLKYISTDPNHPAYLRLFVKSSRAFGNRFLVEGLHESV